MHNIVLFSKTWQNPFVGLYKDPEIPGKESLLWKMKAKWE